MNPNEQFPFASRFRAWKQRSCLAFAALILGAGSTLADTTGLFLPNQPHGQGGQDQIESTTGARCSQSINSSGTYLDVGMTSTTDTDRRSFKSGGMFSSANVTGYVRVVMPLGYQPKRLDCARLYEMELQRLRQELELMKMGAE